MSSQAGTPSDHELAERIGRLEARMAAVEAGAAARASWYTDLQAEVASAAQAAASANDGVRGHEAWLRDLERWVSSCVKTLSSFGGQPLPDGDGEPSGTLDPVASLVCRLQVATVMDWIAEVEDPLTLPLISVTMATRNRPGLLPAALRSVLDQSYRHLELIVVDDSDDEETQEVLATVDDDRLRVLRNHDHRGPGYVYNMALDAVRGDIVAFLDDDNVMHRAWLRSVAWAFEAFPDADALYGARTNEDPGAQRGVRSGMLPTLEFSPYDRARHERAQLRGPQHHRLPLVAHRRPLRRVPPRRVRLGPLAAPVRAGGTCRPPGPVVLLPHRAGRPGE